MEGRQVSLDPTLLDDLEWRGLLAHSTDLDALREALSQGSVRFYVGFDPTAPSLHMGHLVQVLTARRLQQAGHPPYALVGGATGMIGDPKDSGERTLNSLDVVKDWVGRVRAQIEPFLAFDGPNAATMVNNYDWTASLSTIDFLRDVGKHFPVNRMLARDVVSRRLEQGISYTEFSYVLLQSWDFLNLYRDHGVTLQFGGSDQWGNLTAGVELIRRSDGGACPRVRHAAAHQVRRHQVRQDRGRGAVARPGDALAVRLPPVLAQRRGRARSGELLRVFTFLSREEIEALEERDPREAVAARRPEGARRRGDDPRPRRARDGAGQGRRRGAVRRGRPPRAAVRRRSAPRCARPAPRRITRRAALGRGPAGRVRPGEEQGRGAAHHRRGRRLPQQRCASRTPTWCPAADDLIDGEWLVLRRGKKNFAGVQVAPLTCANTRS